MREWERLERDWWRVWEALWVCDFAACRKTGGYSSKECVEAVHSEELLDGVRVLQVSLVLQTPRKVDNDLPPVEYFIIDSDSNDDGINY